jgi:hypothetical protein
MPAERTAVGTLRVGRGTPTLVTHGRRGAAAATVHRRGDLVVPFALVVWFALVMPIVAVGIHGAFQPQDGFGHCRPSGGDSRPATWPTVGGR